MSTNRLKNHDTQVSIIIPTYNESQNILQMLQTIRDHIPKNLSTEAIVVDDNSPDGTGKIVEDYLKDFKKAADYTINVIHRKAKNGLSSAILNGIQSAKGETIVIMDSDFSHPPQIIPKMIEAFKQYQCDLVVASRYIRGGGIQGWSIKRKLMSKVATTIAKKGLGVKIKDPMSGFFAFKKNIINEINFDGLGYKLLLELLVKKRGIHVKEIPYTFEDRKKGSSKLDSSVIFDYVKSVYKLYKNGKSENSNEKRQSVKFISKAARFYTVGATGFFVNYVLSLMFADHMLNFWYIHASIVGIIGSMTTNFILNKYWTFEDRDFALKRTIIQYGKYVVFSSLGAFIQLGLVYGLVDGYSIEYPIALIVAVITAALGNFVLNKKFTFKERIW